MRKQTINRKKILVGFYGISTSVDYLMPNPFYTSTMRLRDTKLVDSGDFLSWNFRITNKIYPINDVIRSSPPPKQPNKL